MLEFFSQLNSIHPELQFTLHHSTESVPFLDTLVMKDIEGNLSTDLYCKPTDSNSLLHYSSCHPRTTKNSLPRSQFDRVSRIVSNPEIRKERLDTTAHKFELRHYPPKLLDFEKTRALTPPSPQPPMYPRDRIPFVHTFHPTMPRVYSIIKKHWPLLSKAYPEIDSFKAPTLICTKRPSNIRDKLVRADVGSSRPTSIQKTLATRRQGTFPCLNCAACSNVIKSDNITHPRTGKSFPIKGFHTCNSNFVVYLVKCPCGLLYVGETTQHVRDRIASHKSTIRCNKNWLPIPEHFSKSGHSVAQLRFQVIEHVPRPRRGGNHRFNE
ncbi:unnamed protein product [Ranitomeya imitator]|uniref:Helix-turn-helix domain-containing protein n=1 Tax=Ranitomeya imitator TaxID=111125 RepID=A0ABN9MEB6_9NEOB|nr:unnamed protein product [Ranitomeya imitator]